MLAGFRGPITAKFRIVLTAARDGIVACRLYRNYTSNGMPHEEALKAALGMEAVPRGPHIFRRRHHALHFRTPVTLNAFVRARMP